MMLLHPAADAKGPALHRAVIDHGPGLAALPWIAALLPLSAAALAIKHLRTSRLAAAAG
jgi:DHA1 family inner membrane transport protein